MLEVEKVVYLIRIDLGGGHAIQQMCPLWLELVGIIRHGATTTRMSPRPTLFQVKGHTLKSRRAGPGRSTQRAAAVLSLQIVSALVHGLIRADRAANRSSAYSVAANMQGMSCIITTSVVAANAVV